MPRTIKLFMWGYQESFRVNLESKARTVMQDIAPGLVPHALLVGVRVPNIKEPGHPVCVEPERQEWDPSIFFQCAERTEEIYKKHPGHRMRYGDEASNRDQPENVRKASVYEAVKEVFDAYDEGHGTRTFCISPVKLYEYFVVPALQFSKAGLAGLPALERAIEHNGYKVSGGFHDCVIRELLEEAQRGLGLPEPGRFFRELTDDTEAILRKAGDTFCSVLLLASKDLMFQGTFKQLNNISANRYEGAPGVGGVVVAAPDHPAVDMRVEFTRPVPLSEPRWARKVLEMSKGDMRCVCTGTAGLRGLGVVTDESADGLFLVDFLEHFTWQLRHKGKALLRSSYGVPRLPRAPLKEDAFRSTIRRVFAGTEALDQELLWRIASAATRQRHGTMVVISGCAEAESKRLANQATPVVPLPLTEEVVERVSGIDGAILIDQRGTCYAIGVILDGIASDAGTSARGARYNSAIRYYNSSDEAPVLILVFSEDGGVDMIPTLRPQMTRSSMSDKVRLLALCDIDNYAPVRNWLRDHKFYLTADQCEAVNKEIRRIESIPLEDYQLRIDTETFVPDPDMNDSYFLPEEQLL